MIKKLYLTNFKGFEQHEIEFRAFSVAVGHNNAGKSSAIEALRIIATVAKKFLTHRSQKLLRGLQNLAMAFRRHLMKLG